jgi:hypothetical protein
LRDYTLPPEASAPGGAAGGGPRRRKTGQKPGTTGGRTGNADAEPRGSAVAPDVGGASAPAGLGSAQQARRESAASATLALRGTGATAAASAAAAVTQLGASLVSPHDPVTAAQEREHRGSDDLSSEGFRGVAYERDGVDPARSQPAAVPSESLR